MPHANPKRGEALPGMHRRRSACHRLIFGGAVPTAVPMAVRSGRFAGLLSSTFRVMMTEDAKFALGF
jgi:hypothetical protein